MIKLRMKRGPKDKVAETVSNQQSTRSSVPHQNDPLFQMPIRLSSAAQTTDKTKSLVSLESPLYPGEKQ